MAVSQVTLRELLKDPLFRQWFTKVPTLRFKPRNDPWRVYLLEEAGGRWSKIDFPKYSSAYKFVRDSLRDVHDITINCPSQGFRQPVVREKGKRRYYTASPIILADANTLNDAHKHVWCPFCRRWTLFLWYKRHHSLPKSWGELAPSRRCKICGVRLEFVASGRR